MSLFRNFPLSGALAAGFFPGVHITACRRACGVLPQGPRPLFHDPHAPEIQALDTGVHKGWTRTGLTIQTVDGTSGAGVNSVAVCRFYGNPARGLDSHFYAASKAECDLVKRNGRTNGCWSRRRRSAFMPSTRPLACAPAARRACTGCTTSGPTSIIVTRPIPAVFDSMIAKGYAAEGFGNPQKPIVFCASSQARRNRPPARRCAR